MGGGRLFPNNILLEVKVYPYVCMMYTYLDIFVDEWHLEGGQHERDAKRKGGPDPVHPDEPDDRENQGGCDANGPASFRVNPPVGLL